MDWKDLLEGGLKSHLNAQLKESMKHKSAYVEAKNPSNAQLWVAIATLSQQMFNLNLKLDYLERALKDIGKTNKTEVVQKLGLLELELKKLLDESKPVLRKTSKKTTKKRSKK